MGPQTASVPGARISVPLSSERASESYGSRSGSGRARDNKHTYIHTYIHTSKNYPERTPYRTDRIARPTERPSPVKTRHLHESDPAHPVTGITNSPSKTKEDVPNNKSEIKTPSPPPIRKSLGKLEASESAIAAGSRSGERAEASASLSIRYKTTPAIDRGLAVPLVVSA
ncbi:hypothetical protein CIRG_02605 [Coccidioides immitis RMSCC 2394]|uniref:Uncharacterized protein n=1 Tax=Coccidioides immitis RMSCC 2394 TaxID=404692 RepID=A0A0J6Y880_COCIT|nr:hypothetical protein CIRG_02605 [Coccidioides immitis RMSCC 2394]